LNESSVNFCFTIIKGSGGGGLLCDSFTVLGGEIILLTLLKKLLTKGERYSLVAWITGPKFK
jgi:hypothetical protein